MAKSPEASESLVDVIAAYRRGDWGFTGTRAGMRAFQVALVRRVLTKGQPIVFRHGGAFGSDFEAHAIWREVCKENSIANVWPADAKRAQMFHRQERVKVEPIMPPLDRNIEIVKRSDFLIATPNKEYEEQRSGTWATIRQMLKLDKPVLIIWPSSNRLTLCRDKILHRVTHDSV